MKNIKYIILIILISFLFLPTVNASTNTYERNIENNYGVKKFDIKKLNLSTVKNTPYVDAKEKIYDFSNILTDDEEQKLLSKIENYIKKTGFDLVIVTVNLPYTSERTNVSYATNFYDYNDFGINMKNKSGVLLLRNTYSRDPYYEYYMFGDAQLYYKEPSRVNYILDNIYDNIHRGNYYDGFSSFINYLDSYYDKGIPYSYKDYYIDSEGMLQKRYSPPYFIAFAAASLVTIITIIILMSKNRMVRLSKDAKEYIDKNSINFTEKTDNFVSTHTTSHVISSSSGSSGGGGGHSSSRGSSGGGFSRSGGRHG